jgi:hypothetical protein
MSDPAHLLTLQFLDWLAQRPRSYGEVMDAWCTSCPRLPVWEAAIDQGYARINYPRGVPMAECPVVLTDAGRQLATTAPATISIAASSSVIPAVA